MDALGLCFVIIVVCLLVASYQYDKVRNRKKGDKEE